MKSQAVDEELDALVPGLRREVKMLDVPSLDAARCLVVMRYDMLSTGLEK